MENALKEQGKHYCSFLEAYHLDVTLTLWDLVQPISFCSKSKLSS